MFTSVGASFCARVRASMARSGSLRLTYTPARRCNGSGEAGPSVTVELSTQFVGAGDPARPLDAVSEIVRETGRMLFLRGFATQPRDDGTEDIIASYSGIVRKMRSRA